MQMDSPMEGGKEQTSRLVMQEMENLRQCTTKLEGVLQKKLLGDPVSTAILKELRDYAAKVSLLLAAGGDAEGSSGTKAASVEVQGAGGPEGSIGSPSSVDQMSDASAGKRKLPQTGDGRRGGCRRRSQQYAAGIRRVECKNLDDGHSWRKYGQKDIQTTKFPRSYFRCTHKYTQGCKAQRQVQKSENETSTFIITYIGEHTCTDPAAVALPHRIMSTPNSKGSYLISFGSGNTTNYSDSIQITAPSLKMEHDVDDQSSNLTTGSSSSNHRVLPTPAGITPIAAPSPSPLPVDASSMFQSPCTRCVAPMEFVSETSFEYDDLQDLQDVCDYFLSG